MLSVKLNKEPLKLNEVITKFEHDFDIINIYLITKIDDELFDVFAGAIKYVDGHIESLDGDSYSENMNIWYFEEFEPTEGLNFLDIWVTEM